jgi:hypothetical protein
VYKCPYCGGNHRKADSARKCKAAKEEMEAKDRNYDTWATSGRAEREGLEEAEPAQAFKVANGHYFLESNSWLPKGARVWVRRSTHGRWKGLWFVTVFEPDCDPAAVADTAERNYVIDQLVRLGPVDRMAQYGRVFRRCGVCNDELTDEEVRETAGHQECFDEAFDLITIKA